MMENIVHKYVYLFKTRQIPFTDTLVESILCTGIKESNFYMSGKTPLIEYKCMFWHHHHYHCSRRCRPHHTYYQLLIAHIVLSLIKS